ncbi:D-alanyl-D-alanine carboxypeptidase family protein [Lactococcus nasutitermitis]|uniref:D-alanyl-D-alanine carboxypeptidase family protein n=1 Tax=Lactococcus nasutitermitis TaxID=1652957 RepID=A0ABV9JDW1_9LACT|nr:D-alanyl-D-alanine carboxypeptidase family protein [Lactococcus nasutitermitis]
MKSKRKTIYIILSLIGIALVIGVTLILPSNTFHKPEKTKASTSQLEKNIASSIKSSESSTSSSSTGTALPIAHRTDWDLVLVNRQHPKAEMNPQLTTVDGKQVDVRIATAVKNFLTAAQQISPEEHLISGYRSVAYQTQLYNQYIADEMAGDGTVNTNGTAISKAQAIQNVQTYSQPPECSEHETGLAIDMSNVNSLNASPLAISSKVAALAPKYGFVQRFTSWGENSTGVHPEDWHFRYVGVQNAEYMTSHHLTLEEYLQLLPE